MTEQELKDKQRATAYRMTFTTDYGKQVMDDLAKQCHVDIPSFNVNNPDPLTTAYKEGERSVYLYIQRQINKGKVNE